MIAPSLHNAPNFSVDVAVGLLLVSHLPTAKGQEPKASSAFIIKRFSLIAGPHCTGANSLWQLYTKGLGRSDFAVDLFLILLLGLLLVLGVGFANYQSLITNCCIS